MTETENWIREQIKKGYKKEQIKECMRKEGYPKEAIDSVDRVIGKKNLKPALVLLSLLIVIIVVIAFYFALYQNLSEKKSKTQEEEYFYAPIPENDQYELWCKKNETWEECGAKDSFLPNQLVSISVNLKKFGNIPYDPYYICYYSDLSSLGTQCSSRSASLLGGISLTEESIPNYKEDFTLLQISVFPNNKFEESDMVVILNLEGKVRKE